MKFGYRCPLVSFSPKVFISEESSWCWGILSFNQKEWFNKVILQAQMATEFNNVQQVHLTHLRGKQSWALSIWHLATDSMAFTKCPVSYSGRRVITDFSSVLRCGKFLRRITTYFLLYRTWTCRPSNYSGQEVENDIGHLAASFKVQRAHYPL